MQFHKELDARGLNCPLPILRAKKALAFIVAQKAYPASWLFRLAELAYRVIVAPLPFSQTYGEGMRQYG